MVASSPSPFKGEVGRGMGLYGLHRPPDLFLHAFRFLKDLVIPQSQHFEPGFRQLVSSFLIVLVLVQMLTAIYLDHQPFLKADEVEIVILKWVLTAKLQAGKLATPQKSPQETLGIGHVIAESFLAVDVLP
jgi:hypothetical protein